MTYILELDSDNYVNGNCYSKGDVIPDEGVKYVELPFIPSFIHDFPKLLSYKYTGENTGEGIVVEDESLFTLDIEKYSKFDNENKENMINERKSSLIRESSDILKTYLETHPIQSNCHGGEYQYYSITSEKQAYIQNMIGMTQISLASGIDFQPSWNTTGEECTYDWTLEELQTLAFQMSMTVRPLVSQQQKYEILIKGCTTLDELNSINIVYGDDGVSTSYNLESDADTSDGSDVNES